MFSLYCNLTKNSMHNYLWSSRRSLYQILIRYCINCWFCMDLVHIKIACSNIRFEEYELRIVAKCNENEIEDCKFEIDY